jgi:hypothetical protein
LHNAVSGVFSAIFGKKGTKQTVSLNMNTNITITGNATNSFGLTNPFLVLPGQSNSQIADGPIPNYPDPFGVFTLSSMPHLNYTHVHNIERGNPHSPTTHLYDDYYITKPDLSNLIVYNDAVIKPGVASATIVKQDLIFIPDPTTPWTNLLGQDGATETINNQTVYVSTAHFNIAGGMRGFRIAWRYVIKITPSDGSPEQTIVKTFLATSTVTSTTVIK